MDPERDNRRERRAYRCNPPLVSLRHRRRTCFPRSLTRVYLHNAVSTRTALRPPRPPAVLPAAITDSRPRHHNPPPPPPLHPPGPTARRKTSAPPALVRLSKSTTSLVGPGSKEHSAPAARHATPFWRPCVSSAIQLFKYRRPPLLTPFHRRRPLRRIPGSRIRIIVYTTSSGIHAHATAKHQHSSTRR